MSSTLYRKYRPKTFAEVVDQNPIKITLLNELKLGRPAHAYIFSGPRGVGKTSVARIFAKSLNCKEKKEGEVEPCAVCTTCQEINEGRHIDVIEIDAASHTGVDHVRSNIIESSRFAPQMGGYKVFIIDEVHMLSMSAFNALLKTLEEPPSKVVFILATTELHKVPETIVSRCQRFDFRTIDLAHLVDRLAYISTQEGFEVDPEVLTLIASRSGGYLRDAESTLGQLLSLGEKRITLDQAWFVLPKGNFESVRLLILDVLAGRAKECVERLLALAEEGVDMKMLLGDITRALRELIIYHTSGIRSLTFEEYFSHEAPKLRTALAGRGSPFLLRFLENCIRRYEYFRYNIPEYIPVELALLDSIDSSSPPSFEELERAERGVREEKEVANPVSLSLTHEEVMQKWNQVMEESGSLNHSIKLILGNVKPLDVQDGWFRLAIGYDLHARKLSDQKTRNLVESVLKNVYGQSLKLRVEQDESMKAPNLVSPQAQSMVEEVMKNFGGREVD